MSEPGKPIAYVLDEVFERHAPPRAHPERPERLAHLRGRLSSTPLASEGLRLPTRAATLDELARAHEGLYLESLERTVPGRSGWLDADTYFSEATWEAALAAAGGAADLAAALLDGRADRGVALIRPPGHHATADQAMGFCLLNNVAVAAAAARAAGAARVAIVDFDVHHGNGTEAIFYDDPSVLFLSVHQYPFYPGTGAPGDVGEGAGVGATINVGLPAGCGDGEYLAVFDRVFAPALARFAPDLILVSAGYDAAAADPLAAMQVTADGYRRLAARLIEIARAHAGGRIGAVLEGGYDLEGLADGVVALIEVMMGRALEAGPDPVGGLADPAIAATLAAHRDIEGSPVRGPAPEGKESR